MNGMPTLRFGSCTAVVALAWLQSIAPTVCLTAAASIRKPSPSELVTVRGTAVNADGKPVYGVKGVAELVPDVKLPGDGSGHSASLPEGDRHRWSSGSGGKFVIKVRPGTYRVWAEGAMRSAVTLVVPSDKSSVPVRVLVGLPAGYVKVKGTVVTTDGTPIKYVNGRTATVSGKGSSVWSSDRDGKFVIDLTPGTYRLWALGAKSKAVTLAVPKGRAPVSVRVIAKRTGNRLPIRFLMPDGRPATNVLMGSSETTGGGVWGSGPVSTDARGMMTWVVEDDAPIWLLFAGNGVGYAKVGITDDETLFSDQPVVIQLTEGPYVSGRVVSRSGSAPLGGIRLYPRRIHREGDPWSMWNSQFGFKSYPYTIREVMAGTSHDGDGAFMFGPLPPGEYELVMGLPCPFATDLGSRVGAIEGFPLDVTQGRGLKDLTFAIPLDTPVCSLRGRVLRADGGTPLASTEISVALSTDYPAGHEPEEWYVWEPAVRRVTTDVQGTFRLYPVYPGRYKLEARSGNLSAVRRAVVSPDAPILDFVLRMPAAGKRGDHAK